ncbi:MAG: GAF domain-containing protein [Candidatus Eisenbacteria bacterium]
MTDSLPGNVPPPPPSDVPNSEVAPGQASTSPHTTLGEDIFELIQEGVAVLDPSLSIQLANPAFRQQLRVDMTAQPRPSVATHPLVLGQVVGATEPRTLFDALKQTIETGVRLGPVDVEFRFPESEDVVRFSVQAKRRLSINEHAERIILWVKPVMTQASPTGDASGSSHEGDHAVRRTAGSSSGSTGPDAASTGANGAASIGAHGTAHTGHGTQLSGSGSVEQDVQSLVRAFDLFTDFGQLCNHVLDLAREVAHAGSGSLMLIQPNGRELGIVASHGLSDQVISGTRLPLGEGIAGRVAETGEPLLLDGRVGDSRFRGIGGRPEVFSSVCVPIKTNGQVLGVLSLNSAPNGGPFDESTRDRTAELGLQLGAVLRHSHQFQAMKQRSTQLAIRAEIETIAYAHDDLDTKLRKVLPSVERLLHVDTCQIWLVDGEKTCLHLTSSLGLQTMGPGRISVPLGVGLVGWAAQQKAPATLTTRNHRDPNASHGFTTLAVPMRKGDEVLGVLVVEDSRAAESAGELREVVVTIAEAIGRVIRDAEVQDESKRKLTVLSALSEIGLAMTDSPDSASFAKLAAYCAVTILERDIAFVRLAPGAISNRVTQSAELELLAAHGISAPESDEPLGRLESFLIDQVIATGQIKRDLDVAAPEVKALMEQADVRAALCIPLMSGDALVGTISVFGAGSSPSAVDRANELDIGERLGDYAAAAARRFVLLAS